MENNDEKVLIKSEPFNIKKFKRTLYTIGIVLFALIFFLLFCYSLKESRENKAEITAKCSEQWDKAEKNIEKFKEDKYGDMYKQLEKIPEGARKDGLIDELNKEAKDKAYEEIGNIRSSYYVSGSVDLPYGGYFQAGGGSQIAKLMKDKKDKSYYIKESWKNYKKEQPMSGPIKEIFILSLIPLAILSLFGFIVHQLFGKNEITVTDKRVIGKTTWRKVVELPLDEISAIAIGGIKGVAVATSSGTVKFSLIKNREEIFNVVSELLRERQDSPTPTQTTTPVVQNVPLSDADEIAKYKALLDSGAITQDEYNAKKKQLLGL